MSKRQQIGAVTTYGNTGPALTVALTRDIRPGSLLVAFLRWETGDVSVTISDTSGAKNWKIYKQFTSAVGVCIAYCWGHPGGSSVTTTFAFGSDQSYRYAALLELTGNDVTDPLEFAPRYLSDSSGSGTAIAGRLFLPGTANADSFLAAGSYSAFGAPSLTQNVVSVYHDAYSGFSRNPIGAAGGRLHGDAGGQGVFAAVGISIREPFPKRRRIWAPAVAGGLPTLTASTYKPGTLTSSDWTPRITAS